MEKSSTKIRRFLSVAVLGALVLCCNSFATKIAPLEITEIYDNANIVAELRILSFGISDSTYLVVHTGEKKRLIQYTADMTTTLKGVKNGRISFLSQTSLGANLDYLVFLDDSPSYSLPVVAQSGYAAIQLDSISMKDGFYRSARIPSAFITSPKEIPQEPGVTKRNEYSEYVWVKAESLLEFLKKSK